MGFALKAAHLPAHCAAIPCTVTDALPKKQTLARCAAGYVLILSAMPFKHSAGIQFAHYQKAHFIPQFHLLMQLTLLLCGPLIPRRGPPVKPNPKAGPYIGLTHGVHGACHCELKAWASWACSASLRKPRASSTTRAAASESGA